MMQTLCNKHGSTAVVHEHDATCPLCAAIEQGYGLIQLMLDVGALPELPEGHSWTVFKGTLRVIGSDWGHCSETCTHVPFVPIPLPIVPDRTPNKRQSGTPTHEVYMVPTIEHGRAVRKVFFDLYARSIQATVQADQITKVVAEAWLRSPERTDLLNRIGEANLHIVEAL